MISAGSRPAASAGSRTSRHSAPQPSASGPVGIQPSNQRAARRRAAGTVPPPQTGGPPLRCGTNSRQSPASVQRPFQSTGRPRHSARHRRRLSTMRPARFSNGTPAAANSARTLAASLAMPTPRIRRPSAMRSTVAAWCARRTGWRSAGSRIAVPTAARRVSAATAASSVNGSCRGRASSESPTHSESYPSASARSASASSGAAAWLPATTRSRVGSSTPSFTPMPKNHSERNRENWSGR